MHPPPSLSDLVAFAIWLTLSVRGKTYPPPPPFAFKDITQKKNLLNVFFFFFSADEQRWLHPLHTSPEAHPHVVITWQPPRRAVWACCNCHAPRFIFALPAHLDRKRPERTLEMSITVVSSEVTSKFRHTNGKRDVCQQVSWCVRWNVSSTLWIYRTYAFSKKPKESVWKGEAQRGRWLSELSHFSGTNKSVTVQH